MKMDIQEDALSGVSSFLLAERRMKDMIYDKRVVLVTGNQVVGYMTVSQFGKKHDKSCATIRYWILSGELDAIKIGRTYYIPEDEKCPVFRSRGRVGKQFRLCDSADSRKKHQVNAIDEKILDALSESAGMNARDIWKKVSDYSLNTIYNHLGTLMMIGLIKRGAC